MVPTDGRMASPGTGMNAMRKKIESPDVVESSLSTRMSAEACKGLSSLISVLFVYLLNIFKSRIIHLCLIYGTQLLCHVIFIEEHE